MTAADCGKLGYKIITFPVSRLLHRQPPFSLLKHIKENETDEGYGGEFMALPTT